MKYLIIPYILLILLIQGCDTTNFSKFYPYSQLPPEKVSELLPKKYDDALRAFDTILTPSVKNYFKNSDSTVAVIEICDELGGFFTTRWGYYRYNKQYHWPYDKHRPYTKTANEVASQFISDGIYHPKAMMRILFNCYHKYLNDLPYNWQAEIARTKKLWPAGDPTDFNPGLPDTIKKIEAEQMLSSRFNLLNVNDTVEILYNRIPKLTKKTSDWYYLTGIIQSKYAESKEINVRLIAIESEFRSPFVPWGNDSLYVGDTLTDDSYGWLKKGVYYFNYHTGKEYREIFSR